MSRLNGLPKYRRGIVRFAAAEMDLSKKARRFSITRIEGRLRDGSVWRVTEDIFTSNQADRIVDQLNRLAQERNRTKSDSCIVLNVNTLKAYLCPLSKAKGLQSPELVID
jgi:hypothetical protein